MARAPRLRADPTHSFLAIGECPHLHEFAVAESEDIRQAHILPDVATVGADPGVDKNDDSVAGGE